MLHYVGFGKESLRLKPLIEKNSHDENYEILLYYDEELSEDVIGNFKNKLEEILDEYSPIIEYHLYIQPANILDRINVEITIYYNPNKDKSEQITEVKSSFEKYYKQVVTPYYKKNKILNR